MPVVALTGGVAAGKSTVSAVLQERGAVVLDADVYAREAVSPGSPGLAAVVERFGDSVMDADGTLDRAALGALVFGNTVAKADLEAIIHPLVRRLSAEAIREVTTLQPETVLVYDIPLLAESRDPGEFDVVVLVDAPSEQRQARLESERGFSAEEASARVLAQASDEQRHAIADVVLDASQSVEVTQAAAHELFDALTDAWPDRLAHLPRIFPLSAT